MKRQLRKVLGVVSAAAMTLTSFAGASASSLTDPNILLTDKTVSGGGQYISTHLKAEYFGKQAFKVTYRLNKLDADGKVTVDGAEKDIDYTDTLDFKVFDMNWGGWNATGVGEVNPVVGEVYTATASIADIEKKLAEGSTVQGINFETGNIGDAEVEVLSLEYVNADMAGASATFEGTWTKNTGGTMEKTSGTGTVSTNQWNIQVSDICAYGFKNPTVDVTVKYDSIPSSQVQAEILAGVGSSAKPIVPYYPQIKQNMLNGNNEITFTTEFNANLTSMTICYDACTVKKIHIYDNTADDKDVTVTGKTADQIAQNMGVAWNLGNALDCTDASGNADEVAWGNPVTTKKLIQAVKKQGFNTVRIPVSYVNMIKSDNTVDKDYLARVKQVVDYANSMGMYAVINMHNDGGNGIATKWIDITKTGDEFKAVKEKFAAVWADIAKYFKAYDQKLVFEGYNELMNGNYNSNPTSEQIANVNTLAQTFVTAVRGTGSKNDDRVLIVAGYNTNIQQTVDGFVIPSDTKADRLMLSVHYYDPYNFTLNENGGNTWDSATEKGAISEAIETIAGYASDEGVPVFIGEYGPIDKNNTAARKDYCYWLNYYAKHNSASVNIVTAYWDNGVTASKGSALFDRVNNTVTATGTEIISEIRRGAGL